MSRREPGMIPFIFSHCFRGANRIVLGHTLAVVDSTKIWFHVEHFVPPIFGHRTSSLSGFRIFLIFFILTYSRSFLVAIWPNMSPLLFVCNLPLPQCLLKSAEHVIEIVCEFSYFQMQYVFQFCSSKTSFHAACIDILGSVPSAC